MRDLVEEIVPQLPALSALVFEIVPDYMPVVGIGTGDNAQELEWLHRVWNTRGRKPRRAAAQRVPVSIPPVWDALAEVQEWERALGAMLTGAGAGSGAFREVARIPEVESTEV